ncbi:MAG: hypothetical protein ACP5KW_12350, partial [Thermoproteota archaeon]
MLLLSAALGPEKREEVLTKYTILKILQKVIHPSFYPLVLANVIDSVRPREDELAKYAVMLYMLMKTLWSPSQEETINSLRQEVRWINEKINENIGERIESLEQKIN